MLSETIGNFGVGSLLFPEENLKSSELNFKFSIAGVNGS